MDEQLFCIMEDSNYDYAYVIGYVLREEDAQQLCVQHNETCDREWEYVAVNPMTPPVKKVRMVFVHRVVFDKVKEEFVLRRNSCGYAYYKKGDPRTLSDTVTKNSVGNMYTVSVVSGSKNRTKAVAKAKALLKEHLEKLGSKEKVGK